MRARIAQLAAISLLSLAAITACQPSPGGSEVPAPETQAPGSEAPGSDAAAPAPSETPRDNPNY